MRLRLLSASMSFMMWTSLCCVRGEAILSENVGSFHISDYSALLVERAAKASEKSTVEPGMHLDVRDPLQQTVRRFLDANKAKKLGMVIGRGNVQGIAEERITIDSLKGLRWLFVDPGDVGAVGYLQDNDQDETQGNALKTTWPVDFSLAGQFDAVVIDDGVLQYIGDEGAESKATGRRDYYQEKKKEKK